MSQSSKKNNKLTENKESPLWILPIHLTHDSLKEQHISPSLPLYFLFIFKFHRHLASAWIRNLVKTTNRNKCLFFSPHLVWLLQCTQHYWWLLFMKFFIHLASRTPVFLLHLSFTLFPGLLIISPSTKHWWGPDIHHETPSLHILPGQFHPCSQVLLKAENFKICICYSNSLLSSWAPNLYIPQLTQMLNRYLNSM